MEVNRSDGFSQNVYGNEVSPRMRLGYETADGAGVRMQYWAFDHSVTDGQNGAPSSVDTYNIDLELYRGFEIVNGLDLEVSGGVRYSDFFDRNVSDAGQVTSFRGLGGFLGIKATQDLIFDTQGYVRYKVAMINDDSQDNGAVGFDANRTQQELALGIEKDLCIYSIEATGRIGYEWQEWGGYQDDSDGGLMFSGYVFGLDFAF